MPSQSQATPSAAQQRAASDAYTLQSDVRSYQQALPAMPQGFGRGVGMCRADGWVTHNETLDGDFDVDEVLGQSLAQQLLSPKGPEMRATPSHTPWPAPDEVNFLKEYLLGQPVGAPLSGERFVNEATNALVGPGNVLGTTNSLAQAGGAALKNSVDARTATALKSAAQAFEKGTAVKSIRINEYMTLYNAQSQASRKPRLRLRITGMPITVVQPAFPHALRANGGGTFSGPMRNGSQINQAASLAASRHTSRYMNMFSGKVGTGIITFAPSLAIDTYNSIRMDASGSRYLDLKELGARSASSQIGNGIGWAVGAFAMVVAPAVFAGAATVILVGLVAGASAQLIWGWSGAGEEAEKAVRRNFPSSP